MTVCQFKNQKELVCTDSKHVAPTAKDSVNKQKNALNTNYSDEYRIKKALEADDLCYNYETGFHYMKP